MPAQLVLCQKVDNTRMQLMKRWLGPSLKSLISETAVINGDPVKDKNEEKESNIQHTLQYLRITLNDARIIGIPKYHYI